MPFIALRCLRKPRLENSSTGPRALPRTATSSWARHRSSPASSSPPASTPGIANAGGAGRLTAEWIVGGEPSVDLWDLDIRRFAGFHGNRAHLGERTVETLG